MTKKLTKKDFDDFYDEIYDSIEYPVKGNKELFSIFDDLWKGLFNIRERLEKSGYIENEWDETNEKHITKRSDT